MIKTKWSLLILVASLAVTASAQQDSLNLDTPSVYYTPENILRFGNFLLQRSDYLRAAAEYQRYLFTGDAEQRSYVLYQVGRCYLRASQPDQASPYFLQASQESDRSAFRDSATVAFAATLLFAGRNESFFQAADSLQSENVSSFTKTQLLTLKGFHYLRQRQWQEALATHSLLSSDGHKQGVENSDTPLLNLAQRGMNLPKKSPFMAGLMSMGLPGSGKIYAGHTFDGLYSLFLIAGSSWFAYEGYRDDGTSSLKGWLFGSMATVLYAGNIYGSVISARLYNERYERRLAHDIETHLSLWVNF